MCFLYISSIFLHTCTHPVLYAHFFTVTFLMIIIYMHIIQSKLHVYIYYNIIYMYTYIADIMLLQENPYTMLYSVCTIILYTLYYYIFLFVCEFFSVLVWFDHNNYCYYKCAYTCTFIDLPDNTTLCS